MKTHFRYQDYVDEQRSGGVHGVFVDDTGSPGLRDGATHLHPSRKSWVAVVVPQSQIGEVWHQFPSAIAELERLTGAREFHFTDIYMGRREFRSVPLDLRLAFFRFMAEIFGIYQFPVFVQTLDPELLGSLRKRTQFPDRVGPFNLLKHEDMGLLFLLLRVKWYLEQAFAEGARLARIFVDEGFKKNGVALAIPSLQSVFSDGLVCFAKSDTIFPLQLADFAAFCLNRTQLLLGKSEPSELDEKLLRILQPMQWNYQNIPKISLKGWFPRSESIQH